MMKKAMLIPFSIALYIAGLIARKIFDMVWRHVEDSEPPRPDHRAVRWGKLAAALVIEGAIFRAVRGLVDRGAREAFRRATGTWPGEEAPARP